MATPVRRNCRRRCMGCDPCWICRFSYPAYISIAANPSLPTGAGITPTEWVGCHGNAIGTYSPAVPYSYVQLLPGSGPGTIQEVDNGVTVHRTFRTPGWDSFGLYYQNTGLGSYSNYAVDNCSAMWRHKPSTFTDYDGMTGSSTRQAVARCVDTWPTQPRTPESIGGKVEEVSYISVQVIVGNVTDVSQNTRQAAATDSTLVRVLIRENFLGWWQDDASIFGTYQTGTYIVDRVERYQLRLDKPCPRSGTITLPFFGRTLNGLYFGVDSPNPADFQTTSGGVGGAPPSTIANVNGYDVTITL